MGIGIHLSKQIGEYKNTNLNFSESDLIICLALSGRKLKQIKLSPSFKKLLDIANEDATNLDDLNQPYSCIQWGHKGSLFIPPIINDGELNPVRDWFPINSANDSQYPITIFINHKMEVVSIQFTSLSIDDANYYINNMLNEIPD